MTTEPNSGPAAAAATPPDETLAMLYCPICGIRLAQRQCKLSCGQCGYFLSCAHYY